MDIDEAHRSLGLYTGAPREHVDTAYANMAMDLKSKIAREADPSAGNALRQELERIEKAYEVCIGGRPREAAQTQPRKGVRGPIVLAVMVVGMFAIASTSFAGVWLFNKKKAERQVADNAAAAEDAHNAWAHYRGELELDQTSPGRQAATTYERAGELEREGNNSKAAVLYDEALDAYFAAFESEERRLRKRWRTDVVEFWKTNLAGRFPFNPDAEDDAAAADVEELLNPVDGRVRTLGDSLDLLTGIEFAGRKAVAAPPGYRETLRDAAPLVDALFPGGTKGIDVSFELAIAQEAGSGEPRLEFGGQVTGGLRRRDFSTLRWTGDNGGARVGVWRRISGREPLRYIDCRNSDWGLLRLLQRTEYTGMKDGAHAWKLTGDMMDGRDEGRRETVAVVLVRTGEASPFDLGLYTGFEVSS